MQFLEIKKIVSGQRTTELHQFAIWISAGHNLDGQWWVGWCSKPMIIAFPQPSREILGQSSFSFGHRIIDSQESCNVREIE